MMPETLSLNCILLGDDSSEIFEVKILNTEKVSFLKDLIKEKQSPRLNQVDASKLTVWKVSLPEDAITPELTVDDVEERQELRSVKRISSVLGEALVDEYVHILVQAPIAPNPSLILSLNCVLLGADSSNVFTVEIPKTENVSILKDLIKEKQSNRLNHVAASDLILSQVSLPVDDDLEESLKNVDLTPLKPVIPVWQVFSRVEEDRLHVVAQAPANAIRQKRALPESDIIFSRLKRTKIATTAPSTAAKSAVYLRLGPSEKIFDDRPKPDSNIPSVALLYEGFGHFLDIMDGRDDVPGLADINVKKLYSEVDTFASKMNEYYEDEDRRRDAILPCLRRIFSARRGIQIPEIHADPIGSVRSDGHNTAGHGAGSMVVKFENEIPGINTIPQVQLTCYTARLNSTKVDKELYLRWRIPCLGLTIVGCVLTFYAVIAIDHRFRLVSLTPTFSCIESASDGRDRRSLYLAFMAASVLQAHIIQDVEKFKNNLPQEIPLEARRFPAVSKLRKYPSASDDYLNFKILTVFPDRQPYRLLYFAGTPDDQLVLIKFVRQYSIELHHFCAESGHAPRILAFERLPGGWYGIAMEFIEDGVPITASPQLSSHRDRWAKELRCLMDNFHLEGFVHGDLRDANIFCKEESVMLLDFDWGGKDGKVFYPTANLNKELEEGRVCDDLRITKEDDRRVLEKTLDKLYGRQCGDEKLFFCHNFW